MSCQTIVEYSGGTPTITGTVTLFDSTVAFASKQTPSGGSFHLLGQKWFQWAITLGTAADGATGTVFGQYSPDKGTTWRQFYANTIADGLTATPATSDDEVYVGLFKDIRFLYTNAGEVPTVFFVNLALLSEKASSRTVAGADLTEPATGVT